MKPSTLTAPASSPLKKSLVALSLALPAGPFLTACVVNLDWQVGDGVAVTETRSLPRFSRVELESPVRVTIRTGNEYAAYVTGDANLVDYYETDAFGGVLTISQHYAIDPVVEPHITVIVPELRAVTHNGSGTVEIIEDGDFPDLALTVNGGGEILFSGTAAALRAEVNGSGRIYAEGYAAYLQANLRSRGEISAGNLLAGDADVDLSGSGNIYLDLDYGSVLNLVLTGSGRVEWWGAPARLRYELIGDGKVVEHRGLPKKTAGSRGSSSHAAAKAAAADKPYDIVKRKY